MGGKKSRTKTGHPMGHYLVQIGITSTWKTSMSVIIRNDKEYSLEGPLPVTNWASNTSHTVKKTQTKQKTKNEGANCKV